VRLSDRPGSLAPLMARLAQSGANVMHVGHVRTGVGLAIDEVEIDVQAETKGPEHAAQVLEDLRAGGFQILEA
jgi:threonine dehydratase